MSSNEMIDEFLAESFEYLSTMDTDLTELEKRSDDVDLINKVYRALHTIKGSASFLGFKNLEKLSHLAENLLDKIRSSELKINSNIVDVLFEAFDACKELLKTIELEGKDEGIDISRITTRIENCITNEEAAPQEVKDEAEVETKAEVVPEVKTEPEVKDSEAENVVEDSGDGLEDLIKAHQEQTQYTTKDLLSGSDDLEVVNNDEEVKAPEEGVLNFNNVEEKEVPVETKEPEPVPEKPVAKVPVVEEKKSKIADSVVRVNVGVLDNIMNLVGELVLNRNQVLQHSNQLEDPEYTRLSQQLNVITSELQSEVMSTRMQPIGSILTKFERLVRDFARENDKKIQLQLSGQETELDRTLIEAIKDPLVHIIRNCADHGLEKVEDRKAKSKNEVGTISIKAYNESGQVTIEVSDDGKGLDKSKIVEKAVQKGLVSEDRSSQMGDEQIFELVFNPGFSTAEKVTNISGRGVGMDVVKTNIEKIGGTVTLTSEKDIGTVFKLTIPLTLAIVPALIVNSAGENFAIPQLNLVELVRVSEDDANSLEKINDCEFLRLRGKLTPIFRLNDSLELLNLRKDDAEEKENSLMNSDDINIVILNANQMTFGLIVDEILDTQEIVVKPLTGSLKNLNVFGGATIMGDGRVALIVDATGFLDTFCSSSTGSRDQQTSTGNDFQPENETQFQDMFESILFKLNDDRTYCLPLNLVNRLEEFSVSMIEYTCEQPIVHYFDKVMPLVNVEETLKLGGESYLEVAKNLEPDTKVPCLVINLRGNIYGLIVKEILDIEYNSSSVDSSAVDREGIIGILFSEEQAISVLDIYKVIEKQPYIKNENPHFEKSELSLTGQKILLVEDSFLFQKIESEALTEYGAEVIIANNGAEGVDLLKEHDDFTIIITDIEMPVMDGFEFASRARSIEKYKDVPIIAVSTKIDEEHKAKGKEAGFDEHLEKFEGTEMLSTVNKFLSVA